MRMRSESKELKELQQKTIPFLDSLPLPEGDARRRMRLWR